MIDNLSTFMYILQFPDVDMFFSDFEIMYNVFALFLYLLIIHLATLSYNFLLFFFVGVGSLWSCALQCGGKGGLRRFPIAGFEQRVPAVVLRCAHLQAESDARDFQECLRQSELHHLRHL